jgi:phosphoglycerate dehydrogenase-like enzyme
LGLRVELYDGEQAPPEDLSDVAAYVVPYDRGSASRELLRRPMPALRMVQALSAGVEKLLPLVGPDVQLCSGRGLHDASVAEHAIGLILAAQRNLPRWVAQQATGSWSREHTRSLADSRVAVVGYGAIGEAIERRLVACEASVVRVARTPRPGQRVHGIGELPALLSTVDIVVLVLPDRRDTMKMFGAAELAALPGDALVVNVGRGKTLDTDALLAEVATGRLRAALDVTDPEPLPADHPLWTQDGVLITPHVAGGSASFYPRAEKLVVQQLRRFAAGEPLHNVVPR